MKSELSCDFCGQHFKVMESWIYPTKAIELDARGGAGIEVRISEGWQACETCATLIEASDWAQLCRRALLNLRPEEIAAVGEGELLSMYNGLYRAFRDARTGPRQRQRPIVLCANAESLRPPGAKLGYICALCGKALQVTPYGVPIIAAGGIPVCNACGTQAAEELHKAGKLGGVETSPIAEAIMADWEKERKP